MELRHLRYFIAVAEELNFRRAADRLHVSPPTLSEQIRDLEDALGSRLLERDTARVRLTGPGEVALERARRVLEATESLTTATREAAGGKRGVLRIGNTSKIGHMFLPACLNLFREKYPEVEIVLAETGMAEQEISRNNGNIQLAFRITKGTDELTMPGIRQLVVYRQPLGMISNSSHRLARCRRVSLDDVFGERLLAIELPGNPSHAKSLTEIFHARGFRKFSMQKVNSYEAFIALIAGGQGVSLVPKGTHRIASHNLAWRPLREDGDDLVTRMAAIWHEKENSPLVANFISVIKDWMHDQNVRSDRRRKRTGRAGTNRQGRVVVR
ncbi:LysR family transcriptional regulator [Opitutaceae bacterium TAV5]|nr:LysR family transcriptional regulator [Opitutaceae bacterium TAV5]